MQTITATDFARNFRAILDSVEFRHEELMVTRNNHVVARVVPTPATMTTLEVFSDLYQALSPEAGRDWLADSRSDDIRCGEVSDPWES